MASGYRSLLGVWIGGAGAARQGGQRSLLAFWIGGAASTIAPTPGGYRSLLAFWMGGATTFGITPTPVPGVTYVGGGGGISRVKAPSFRRAVILRDDNEILEIISTILAGGWGK